MDLKVNLSVPVKVILVSYRPKADIHQILISNWLILKAAGYIKRPMCLESLKCRRTPRFLRQSLRSRADGSRWRGVGVHTNSNEDISSISTKINLQVGRLSG